MKKIRKIKNIKLKAYKTVNLIINKYLYICRQTGFVLCANTLRLIEICIMVIKNDTSKFDWKSKSKRTN